MTELVGAREVQAALRNADADIRRRMNATVKRVTAPIEREIEASAMRTLPAAGGLNKYVAAIPVRVKVSTSGRSVEFTAEQNGGDKRTGRGKSSRRTVGSFGPKVDLRAINRGRVMHPAWGHGRALSKGGGLFGPQMVKAGYFSNPLTGAVAARAKKAIIDMAADIAADIAKVTGR